LLAFCKEKCVQALQNCHIGKIFAIKAPDIGRVQYILPVIQAFVHTVVTLPQGPLCAFTEDQLFSTILQQDNLVYILAVILLAPNHPCNLNALEDMLILIKQYPSCNSHHWPGVVQAVEENVQQMYGPGNLLSTPRRDLLDNYLKLFPHIKKEVGMDSIQVSFFVHIEGGTFYDQLE
jgi:hypothetical protein